MVAPNVRPLVIVLVLAAALPLRAQPPMEAALRDLQQARESGAPAAIEAAVVRTLAVVDHRPHHPAAPIAVSHAAHAFAGLGRWESAERLWQRVVDEGTPRLGATDDEQLLLTVADALEQLARRAEARSDWSAVVIRYQALVDSPRFRRSGAPGMHERIGRALLGTAGALEHRGDLGAAARALLRAVEWAPALPGGPERLDHAAELFARASLWRESTEASERLLRLYGRSRAHVDPVVRAHDRIVRSLERRGSSAATLRTARARLLTAFERLGGRPGSPAAALAARAALAQIASHRAHTELVVLGGSGRARTRSFEQSMARARERLRARREAYERVLAFRTAEASLLALVAIGDESMELASRAERAGVPAEVRAPSVGALRCEALRRYVLARELASQASLPLPPSAERALAAGPSALGACEP